jgi:hypothetical protein
MTAMFARFSALLLAVAFLAVWPAHARADAPADPLAAVAARVPREVGGLRASDTEARYDSKTIFDYLDGGAEVYLAYRMRACLAREYAAGDLVVTLDLFEMESAADAFGMFTHDQDGDAVEIGQGALFRFGWLSFYQGRFFGSVTATENNERARAMVLALGRAAATAIEEIGHRPDLLARLPREGLAPRSVRFLRSPVLLSAEVDLGSNTPLKLGGDIEVVVGRYERAGQKAVLVVARYPTAGGAGAAAASVHARLPGLHRRLRVSGPIVALVVQQTGSALFEPLLKEAIR